MLIWGDLSCDATARPASLPDLAQTMLDFNHKIVADGRSGSSRVLHDDIAAAYRFASAHCMQIYLVHADALFWEGRYREAFAAYRDRYFGRGGIASGAANDDDLRSFKTGVYAAAAGTYANAQAAFQKSITRDGGAQEAHFLLGQVLFATGREYEARAQWRAALETRGIASSEKQMLGPQPSWMSALHEYGTTVGLPVGPSCVNPKASADRGEPGLAHLRAFNREITNAYASGNLVETRAEIDQAYRYAMTHCGPHIIDSAGVLFDLGRYRDAFDTYSDMYFFPNGNRGFYEDDLGASASFEDGVFAAADGDYRTAERALRDATKRAPRFEEADLMLGDVLFVLGRKHDARVAWLAALGSYGSPFTDKYERPEGAWISALLMYEVHR